MNCRSGDVGTARAAAARAASIGIRVLRGWRHEPCTGRLLSSVGADGSIRKPSSDSRPSSGVKSSKMIRDNMNDVLLVLQQRRSRRSAAHPSPLNGYCSNLRGQTMVLAIAVSSSSVMKMALPVPGRCRTSTRPPMFTRRRAQASDSSSWRDDAARIEIGAQERHRMRLQRQMQMAIVLDHLLARRHRRQTRVGLELRHARRAQTAAGRPCRRNGCSASHGP